MKTLRLIRNALILALTFLLATIVGTIISELLYPMEELGKITF